MTSEFTATLGPDDKGNVCCNPSPPPRMTAPSPRPKRRWLLLAIMIAWAVVDATARRNVCCPRPVDCLLAPATE